MPTQLTSMLATAMFADRHSAHAAVEQLAQAGFARSDLTVVMSADTHDREFGASSSRSSGLHPAPYSGGVLPAIVSSLTAFAPIDGPFLRVSGPLVRALAGMRLLAAALIAVGLGSRQARAIQDGLLEGHIVVVVHAEKDRVVLARQLLELAGGEALRAA